MQKPNKLFSILFAFSLLFACIAVIFLPAIFFRSTPSSCFNQHGKLDSCTTGGSVGDRSSVCDSDNANGFILENSTACSVCDSDNTNGLILENSTDNDDKTASESISKNPQTTFSACLTFDPQYGTATLIWTELPQADYYQVYLNDVLVSDEVLYNFCDVSTVLTYGGEYHFVINAISCETQIDTLTLHYTHFMQLNTPSKLSVLKSTLSWNSVTNATTYLILVDGIAVARTQDTSFDFSDILTVERTYSLQIVAENPSPFYTSSSTAFFSFASSIVPSSPDNLFLTYIEDTFLVSWSHVEEAVIYNYFLQSKDEMGSGDVATIFSTSSTSQDLSALLLKDGDYVFSVQSQSNTTKSSFSSIAFNVLNGIITTYSKVYGDRDDDIVVDSETLDSDAFSECEAQNTFVPNFDFDIAEFTKICILEVKV